MAEMNPVARFFVNLGNARRSARLLRTLDPLGIVPPSSRLLELGAGRGGLSARLAERYRPARLVVTDFDPHQLEAARRTLTRRLGTVPATVELRQVDATQLPFEDRSFDVVFAILMLHHVEAHHDEYRQRPVALREIRRVLVPGGALVYSDFSRTDDLRRTLDELGFVRRLLRRRWPHRELAVYAAPAS